MTWISWIDEWVEVPIYLVCGWLLNLSLILVNKCLLLLVLLSNVWVERSTLLASSSLRDVGPLDYPETILASAVLDSDGVTILTNVAVLSNPLPICPCLFSEDSSILSSKC